MVFNRSNRSHQLAKRGLPIMCDCNESEKKDGVEDFDFDKQLNCIDGLSDENDSMWLSSNCKSPSMLDSDDSQDCFWNLTLSERFSSMLSLSGSYDVIFDGSRIIPIDEASLVLDRQFEGCNGGDSKDETSLWLLKDSSVVCSESGESSYDRSFCEDSSLFESSSTSLSTLEETPTPTFVQDFDRTGIWVSSLDLTVEDCELVQDKEQGFDLFDSDFPSPSFSARQKKNFGSSTSSSIASCESDEPLFWPFDQNSYSNPKFESNFLHLSPRKIETKGGAHGLDGSKPVRARLQKNSFTVNKKKMRGECRRRIIFSPLPKLADAKYRTGGSFNKNIKNISIIPSRLSISAQTPLRKSLFDTKSQKEICEAGNLQEVVEGESIESMVGLNEFDGHEGLGVEFDDEEFTLNGSPPKMTVSSKDIERSRDG